MDRPEYLASLRSDAADLLAAAGAGSLDAAVPGCPGWSLERLVGHVGRVYRWTAGWVSAGRPTPPGDGGRGSGRMVGDGSREIPRPPDGAAVVDWTREGLAELLAALEAAPAPADPDARVPTWAGDQPPVFWPRRMAIETAVHRWDAQSAVGDPRPLGTELALDAVDELLEVIGPLSGADALAADVARGGPVTLHLHATDVAGEAGQGEWLVGIAPDGLTVEHAHAKGDVAVRGTASDLALLLYNRVTPERCEVFGDAGLLERWRVTVKV